MIYIKPAIHGDELEDVLSYAAANPIFPHESTVDQFFSESQFESYRRLGQHMGWAVFGKQRKGDCNAVALAKLASKHAKGKDAGLPRLVVRFRQFLRRQARIV